MCRICFRALGHAESGLGARNRERRNRIWWEGFEVTVKGDHRHKENIGTAGGCVCR